MERNGLARLAPLAGVLFVALIVASFIVSGETPSTDDSTRKVIDYWEGHETEGIVSALLGAYAMVAYLWFVGTLRSVLRQAEGLTGRLSATAFAGGVVFAGYALVGLTMMFAAAETADDVPPAVTQTLSVLNSECWLGLAVGNAVLLLATGVLLLRTGLLPKWLGWVTVLLGVASVTPAGFFAFLATLLWVIGVSIVLYLRGGAAAPPATAPASSPGSPS